MNNKQQRGHMPLRYSIQGSTQACFLGIRMRCRNTMPWLLFLLSLVPLSLFAQALVLPLEINQDSTPYNLQSTNGVPLSHVVGVPPGSDGRAPNDPTNPATTNQFSGLISCGAVVSSASTHMIPVAMSNESSGVVMQLQRAQVGAPFLNRPVSYLFGSVIAPPSVDYEGTLLANAQDLATYWSAEPYSTNNHENSAYYWSPHAEQVYAVQSGPISIVWRKAIPYTESTAPTNYVNEQGSASFVTNLPNIYLLKTESYLISGSPIKTPRKIYWTEKSFTKTGKPVNIPTARVGAVNIVYNNTIFLERVGEEYVAIGDSVISTNGLQELRTLWYDQQQGFMYAYNQEGRVFVELLGDLKDDNVSREQLGFEVVDVIKQPRPSDVREELGERLHPPFPGSIDTLFPEPVSQGVGDSFAYRHTREGSPILELYGAEKTQNLNDYLVHWMEEGEAGILWPKCFARYELVWPTDVTRYSHYVRPIAATDDEAQKTAVQLTAENVPFISYQDPLDRPRAKITADSKFYTWLDSDQPIHRTLLRFTSGDSVAFERVYSWLDETLKAADFEGTVAEELTSIQDHFAFPEAYAGYLDKLAVYDASLNALTRGVNGNWTLIAGDNFPLDAEGSINSWGLEVVSSNTVADLLVTNYFANSAQLGFSNGETNFLNSIVSVDGIDQPVVAIRARLNGVTHSWPRDLELFLLGSNGKVCALMSDAGGSSPGIQYVDLTFDDSAPSPIARSVAPITGIYQPTDYIPGENIGGYGPVGTSLAALLEPATNISEIVFAPIKPPGENPFPDTSTSPRIANETVEVGQRIVAPDGELGSGSGETYQAGHINLAGGFNAENNLYNVNAYIDPFAGGFETAADGAVIPVNAIPDRNELEVWWFRENAANAGINAGDGSKGFATIHWPSVIGRYTLVWPENSREIVMASRLGGENLSPLEAQGSIYVQNDPALDGYNPNEEHALMSGGIPFATRDDLNITHGTGYSSEPFVLVEYTEDDGRPAVVPFKVLREKPEEGYVFDYIVPAGQLLQPLPPLNFLPKPVEGSGDLADNYNTEPDQQNGDLPVNWALRDVSRGFEHYNRFTYRDRKEDFWVYRGLHSGRPALGAGTYVAETDTFVPLTNAVAIAGEPFRFTLHASRQDQYLDITVSNMPPWLVADHVSITGTPDAGDAGSSSTLTLVVEDRYDHSVVSNTLTISVAAPPATAITQSALLIHSTNAYTGTIMAYSNRPPFLAASPTPTNSFAIQYYYKTQDGFAWPGLANPPGTGSIVPYLRSVNPDGSYAGGDGTSTNTASLHIVYRPVWPVKDPKDSAKPLPTLRFGATLTQLAYELPGVRDWITARVLYQQSIAANMTNEAYSAVLHDPTVYKISDITDHAMDQLPGGVKTEYYQGKIYFPNLPPHLGKRLYFDPNRGTDGSLVLKGEYKEEILGANYLQLNMLRSKDLEYAKALCPEGDPDHDYWDAAIDALSVAVETYYEDPDQPGTYAPNTNLTDSVGVGDVVEIKNDNVPRDSYALSATGPGSGYVTLLENSGTAFTEPGDPVAMHIFKVGGEQLEKGELKIIAAENPLSELITFQHTSDLAGRSDEFEYEWKIAAPVDGMPPEIDAEMSRYLALTDGPDLPRHTLGGAGIQALSDNYVVMRYKATDPSHPLYDKWSQWTDPALAEGWIKRVLAGINPFNQRITDLFSNRVNTDVSILTQAGPRWEGDVALNLDTINDYGLIEIYETVLRRGRSLSIEAGYNYGPANDALLLAAGYLSDLYMMLGNEGWADAANPTIGIGTADNTYGDIATALFSFKGQQASLLEEELALLRGRDDVFQPGVEIKPIYNRLIWNYTRGIDAGEVIYALNYNIQENPGQDPDGIINAEDAAHMYPQGHGDAYGHYLIALKGYYSLFMNSKFDWVPRIEAVNILGKPVSVDYQDERKFAAAAAAVARAGRQVFDLTWRKDCQPVGKVGWDDFADSRENTQRSYVSSGSETNHPVRHWGMDQWASRVGQGTYLNWVVGNSMLPAVDPDPDHEGIQKVDRTTVPELKELPTLAKGLQTALDNAEAGFSPLGVPEDAIALDIDPNIAEETHFEQIYARAKAALNNALAAFDDAKDVTQLMRSEQDSLAGLQSRVAEQELAFRNSLIELYGTPYPDDMEPGKTWKQDYDGPDTIHYMYVETPELPFDSLWNYPGDLTGSQTLEISLADLPGDWGSSYYHTGVSVIGHTNYSTSPSIEFSIGPHGYLEKPEAWSSSRASPGRIQEAISRKIAARNKLLQVVFAQSSKKGSLDRELGVFKAGIDTWNAIQVEKTILLAGEELYDLARLADNIYQEITDATKEDIILMNDAVATGLPDSVIVGVASGGDLSAPAKAALKAAGAITITTINKIQAAKKILFLLFEQLNSSAKRWGEQAISHQERAQGQRSALIEIGNIFEEMQAQLWGVNEALREYDDAKRNVRATIADGERIQEEREIFRKRSAALVQGYRTRDAAFRIFRNEKLERYKTLFDLASRYALLAANAYDFETGLLGTDAGREFTRRIIQSRALGVVGANGEPQFAGSNTGDPGLSSALAEMKADWDVVKTRLGFNNPETYGTTASLRSEHFRINPGDDGDQKWTEVLHKARVRDVLEDADVRRYCMQIANGDGLPVPGIILNFRTTITDGYNLFGRPLAGGDHAYSSSSFATKIFAAGVALEGYQGMDNPAANSGAGGESPPDPDLSYLDPLALSATPYIYLIPVGADSMRSPPLGDASGIRSWMVKDVAIPLPFNIGVSDFSTTPLYQSNDSLVEPLFTVRKHQAFRPISDATLFNPSVFIRDGTSDYTIARLIGRSVWNSQWKLVIPGKTLLNNPDEGLDRLIKTLEDVKIHFVTYSYSGN